MADVAVVGAVNGGRIPDSAEPLRVAQVGDALDTGGKERVAVNLANGLAAAGWESHLISTRWEGPMRALVRPEVHAWCGGRRWRFDLRAAKRIADYIADNRIQIVHTHNHYTAYFMWFVLKFCKVHPLHVVHDHHGPAMGNRLMALADWLMFRHVDAYIAVSEELQARAKRILSLSDDRCLYIHNGVEVFPPHEPYQGPPTVVQVANLSWPKGHDVSVRAAAELRKRFPQLRWVCVGRITEPSDYVAQVKGLVRSLGMEDCFILAGEQADVRPALRQANVGVIASDTEGLPMAMLEYMVEELPVVTTDVGQCPALVREAGCGLIVPPRQPDQLAEAIAKLLDDPAQARPMAARGRRLVEAKFSVAAMVERISRLYRDLLEGRRRSERPEGEG